MPTLCGNRECSAAPVASACPFLNAAELPKQVPQLELIARRTPLSRNQGFTFYRYDSDRPPIWRTACARSSRLFRNEQKAKRMQKLLKDFIADESGATAIEYGLIAAGISLAIIAVVNGLGTKLNTKFTSINSSLK
jgi:pilus assembly protein Flp/PilA